MARRSRKQEEVLNSLSDIENPSAPDENSDLDSTPLSAAKRAAVSGRHVSLKECAALLDRDRNTVMKWLDQGCPFVEKADRDLGKSWILDPAAVVRWLEKRAADTVAERLTGSLDGITSEAEAKRRRAVSIAVLSEVEAAETVKTVVRVSAVIDRIAADYNEIRGRLMSIPDAIAGRVEARVSTKVREIADEQIRNALKALKVDKDYAAGTAEG